MKRIYLLCGIPGSGKSTWAKSQLDNKSVWISRDQIRFSMVSESEEYFSKEKEVFREFIKEINLAIRDKNFDNIYIDATHLNTISRYKVLDKIALKDVDELNIVFFNIPLNICLERNSYRSGRERVPEEVIKKMYKTVVPPHLDDKYLYNSIIVKGDE